MKFKEYIDEAKFSDSRNFLADPAPEDKISLEKMKVWRDTINKECKPWVKEVGLFDSPIDTNNIFKRVVFRGLKEPGADFQIGKRKVRKDRRPRYIPEPMHDNLGKITKKMFGWNTRSEGLFTGSFDIANQFGSARVIIPIGPIKYVYMGADDLHNLYLHFDLGGIDDVGTMTQWVSKYKTKGLRRFLSTQNSKDRWECIVKCDSYYSLGFDMIKSLTWNL